MAKTTTSPTPVATPAGTTKRLILIGGGKGGVGKSTFARALCDFYELKSTSYVPYDGDLENPTLSRFFPEGEVLPLATQITEGFEALVRAMEDGSKTQIIADLGAGTQRHLAEFEKVLGLGTAARDFGYQPVLIWLLAPSKDSIGLLGQAVQAHAGWRIVIARAIYEHGDWSLWETSETKKRVDAVDPEVFDFPVLDAKAFTACDKKDLRFKDADRKELSYIEAAYTSRWFSAVRELFEHSAALGGKA